MLDKKKRARLEKWCRYILVDDTRDDGSCDFILKFKIRESADEMHKIAIAMCHDDACEIASDILESVVPGCEECYDDWKNPDDDAYFLDWKYEDGYIVMNGRYRS